MLDRPQPARIDGGIFDRLDPEWAEPSAGPAVQAAVTDWLVTDRLAYGVSAVTDAVTNVVTDTWVRTLGPAHLLAALRPPDGAVTDALTDAVLRALLRRAGGHDRSATLAARIIVQTMIPASVRMTRGQVRPFGCRSFDDTASTTVAVLYEVARSGRLGTRSGRPAAHLALDTLRHVCAELAADREERGEDLAADEVLADTGPGPDEIAEARGIQAAAGGAGFMSEAQVSQARLEFLELVLDVMDAGPLSPADGRASAWHYTTNPAPDAFAATHAETTAGA